MIAISIGNGSGDAQGSQRGLEYDTMSGLYAEFVETEVLPLVESECNVKLTKDPEGRATMGCSSGGSCAMIMAWYRPDLYRRVLTYSGTFVNQQWPYNPETPGGAWEFHETLIPNSPAKPLRIWMQVGDRDLLNPNVMRDDMHDWVLANEKHGQGAGRQGLPLPVRLRPQRRPLRRRREAANAARRRWNTSGRAIPFSKRWRVFPKLAPNETPSHGSPRDTHDQRRKAPSRRLSRPQIPTPRIGASASRAPHGSGTAATGVAVATFPNCRCHAKKSNPSF